MLTKNQICNIEISGLTSEGLGVGRNEGFPVFVKGAAPGDVLTAKILKVERSHAYARIEKIVEESPLRAEPFCPVYEKCGGCSFQHISYDAQLAAKESKVADALRRIGGFAGARADEIVPASDPYRYRNKSVFPLGKDSSGYAVCGLYAAKSHRLVPVHDCRIAHRGVSFILRTVQNFMNTYDIPPYDEKSHTGLIRHVMVRTAFSTGDVMVVIVANSPSPPHLEKLIYALKNQAGVRSICLNINQDRTNVIMGSETRKLWGDLYIYEELCGITFAISAPSFFQINTTMTQLLYAKVLEMAMLKPSSTLIDAYCGIGTISLIAAPHAAKVIGIELAESAVADARTNAEQNGIANAEFIAGKTEDILPVILQTGTRPEVVILDPPRKGCAPAVISAVRSYTPERLVYVSCDPATLARDLKELCADGCYRIAKVVAVDTFPQTPHIETAVLLKSCTQNRGNRFGV